MDTLDRLYTLFLEKFSISTDSRTVKPGAVFFALGGEHFDGNDFAEAAIAAGAAAAVIDSPALAAKHPEDERYIFTENTRTMLQKLARRHRRTLGLPVLAITGTNGKTTTKELVAAVLQRAYAVHYTEGNLNNEIGVPLTLLGLRPEHRLAVVEMGASHAGDIAALAEIAEPDYGIITNIGSAHLEGFGSIEGVRRTKGELFDYLRSRGGIAFVNADDEVLMQMSEGLPRVTYGKSAAAVIRGQLLRARPFTLSFRWCQVALSHDVFSQLVGDYNLPNALVAVAVGRYFDVATGSIIHALSEYVPMNHRSQLIETERNTLIVDTYNANPSSMRVALTNFFAIDSKRSRSLILGEMRELGSESVKEHIELLRFLCSFSPCREIFLVGTCFAEALATCPEAVERLPVRLFASRENIAEELRRTPIEDALLFIKGSHGIHLEKLLDLC